MNWRNLVGIVAVLLFAVGVNLLVWTEQLFSPWVAGPLAGAAVLLVVWTVMVLAGAAVRPSAHGRAVSGINAVVASLVFLGICMVAYAFAQSWDASWDLTREGRRELSPQTVQVLRGMTQEVQVICFFLEVDDELIYVAKHKTMQFLERCRRYTGLLNVELLDPQVARRRLEEGMGITHASPQGTIVLKSGARQKVITLSGGSPRLEERDFTNALVNVLRASKPKIYFLRGHEERSILNDDPEAGGSMLKQLLEAEAYETAEMTIQLSVPEVPRDCDVLVIDNPKSDLHPQEMHAIDDYMARGGRLLVLLNPWRGIEYGLTGQETLRPWLEDRFDITVGNDIVISTERDNPIEVELSTSEAPFAGVEEGFMDYRGAYRRDHSITQGFDQTMLLATVRSVEEKERDQPREEVIVTELLRCGPAYWAETDVSRLYETGQAQRQLGEKEGPLAIACAATASAPDSDRESGESGHSRVVVVGDGDLTANSLLAVPGNFNFVLNAFAWLSESEDLIAIRPTGKEDPALVLTQAEERAVVWVSSLLTVQLVVLGGLAVYFVRRKYQ